VDCVQGKDGTGENGCPSRVVINIINTREVWKVEHGNARELLNVAGLSSSGGGEDSCAQVFILIYPHPAE
jgi:hypothetical protein